MKTRTHSFLPGSTGDVRSRFTRQPDGTYIPTPTPGQIAKHIRETAGDCVASNGRPGRSLPSFRAGAEVRVKIPAGHEPSAYNGERGTLVCQDGEMWQVIFPQHGLTRAFYPDELTVLE